MILGIMGALLIAFVSSGMWLGMAMGVTGLVLLHFFGTGGYDVMVTSCWALFTSYAMTALPVFLILGQFIVISGLGERVYSNISPFFEYIPGKLLQTNVVVAALFGAVSGSGVATTALVGAIAHPELVKKKGYAIGPVASSVAASGPLGMMIPPSVPMILYGVWMEVSIGLLFAAGMLPGIVLALIFMAWLGVYSKLRPGILPVSEEKRMPLARAILSAAKAWPLMAIIFFTLGTIFLGFATPTEAGGLGVAAAIVVCAFYRTITLKVLSRTLYMAARILGRMSLILVGAIILATAVSSLGLPRQLILIIGESGLPPLAILIMIYLMYAVLGCFFDGISFMLMTLPFAFPIVVGLGCDPVWFGVIMVVVFMLGQITPPVGVSLFVVVTVMQGEVTVGEVARGCIPYWICLVVGLVLLTAFPQIALWLPGLLRM